MNSPRTLENLQAALEKAGVEFIAEMVEGQGSFSEAAVPVQIETHVRCADLDRAAQAFRGN